MKIANPKQNNTREDSHLGHNEQVFNFLKALKIKFGNSK